MGDIELLKQNMRLWRLSQEVDQIWEYEEQLDDVRGVLLSLLLLLSFC